MISLPVFVRGKAIEPMLGNKLKPVCLPDMRSEGFTILCPKGLKEYYPSSPVLFEVANCKISVDCVVCGRQAKLEMLV